jgi:hypothetical protein
MRRTRNDIYLFTGPQMLSAMSTSLFSVLKKFARVNSCAQPVHRATSDGKVAQCLWRVIIGPVAVAVKMKGFALLRTSPPVSLSAVGADPGRSFL